MESVEYLSDQNQHLYLSLQIFKGVVEPFRQMCSFLAPVLDFPSSSSKRTPSIEPILHLALDNNKALSPLWRELMAPCKTSLVSIMTKIYPRPVRRLIDLLCGGLKALKCALLGADNDLSEEESQLLEVVEICCSGITTRESLATAIYYLLRKHSPLFGDKLVSLMQLYQ